MILFEFAVHDIFDITINQKQIKHIHIFCYLLDQNGHINIFNIHKMNLIRYDITGIVKEAKYPMKLC